MEDSAWGAVLITMNTLHIIPKISEQEGGKTFYPNLENAQIYSDLHSKFERLYDKLKDEF